MLAKLYHIYIHAWLAHFIYILILFYVSNTAGLLHAQLVDPFKLVPVGVSVCQQVAAVLAACFQLHLESINCSYYETQLLAQAYGIPAGRRILT